MSISPNWITKEGSSCFLCCPTLLYSPHTEVRQILANVISKALFLKTL